MTRMSTALFTVMLILSGLTTATTPLAQAHNASTKTPQSHDMMMGHGSMMDRMSHVDAELMKQMASMMENCNRMMARTPGTAGEPS